MTILSRFVLVFTFALGFAGVADAATLYSQTTTLAPGWNIVSTPRVLDSHSFSATENSTNFDIYVLDGSQTSGWATMAQEGQTEFTPLYGYFIDNKTGSDQTLTFNYQDNTDPNSRLFQRSFSTTGWYSIGVANATYAISVGTTTSDTNNPSQTLSALSGNYATAVDFTDGSYASYQDSVGVASAWKAATASDVNSLNDLRETKGYAVYITTAGALYNGFQNNNLPPAPPTPPTPALALSMSSTPASQTVVSGAQNFTFANIKLDASQSEENVRLSSLPLAVTSHFTTDTAFLSNCGLWNGSTLLTSGSNVVNTLAAGNGTSLNTFVFDNPFTVTEGTVATLSLECSLSSSATSTETFAWELPAATSITSATGVTSGTTLSSAAGTLTADTTPSGTMSVAGSATVAVSTDASSPSYALVAGGTTGVTIGIIKYRPSNEGVNLTKVGLTLGNGVYSGASGSQDVVKAYLYNGSTLLGQAIFAGNATTATSTLTSALNMPNNTDTLITIKADLSDIGTGQPGTEGDLVKIDEANFEGTGLSSGSTVRGGSAGGQTTVAGVRLLNTFPTVSQDILPSSGMADGRLIHFKITADSHGNVGIYQLRFTVATSSFATGGGITNVGLYAFTDSAYSSPISGQGTGGQIGSTISSIDSGAFAVKPTTDPVEVPAGTTLFFELRASVSGVQAGSSDATTLLGDSSFSGMVDASGVSGNFVWSPNATTTTVFSASDWTNGYGVVGIPSSGIVQARSN